MAKKPQTIDYDLRACVVRRALGAGIPRDYIRNEITLDTYSSGGRVDLVIIHPAHRRRNYGPLTNADHHQPRTGTGFDYRIRTPTRTNC